MRKRHLEYTRDAESFSEHFRRFVNLLMYNMSHTLKPVLVWLIGLGAVVTAMYASGQFVYVRTGDADAAFLAALAVLPVGGALYLVWCVLKDTWWRAANVVVSRSDER